MDQTQPLILIDGSSFLYRAYFAAKQGFTTKDGLPTGATYIFTRMLKNLVKKYEGHRFVVVFDAKGPSFRQSMYAEYKATRPPMPEDLRQQIDYVHHIVAAMGFPLIALQGVEADDVLGSYAKEAERLGMKTIICTGDKDLAQLVNSSITLLDTMKDLVYDRESVKEKYGVYPELIVDFLALKGDSADNIPGMKGVGDVTATTILNEMGGVYYIKEHLDDIAKLKFRGSKSFAKNFEEQWPLIEISYKLATIKCDVQLPIAIKDIYPPIEDDKKLIALYERLEFSKFAATQRAKFENTTSLLAGLENSDFVNNNQVCGIDLNNVLNNLQQNPLLSNIDSDGVTASDKATVNLALHQNLNNQNSLPPLLNNEINLPHSNNHVQPGIFANNSIDEEQLVPQSHDDIRQVQDNFKLILTESDLNEFINLVNEKSYMTIKTITTSESLIDAKLVGMAFCIDEQHVYYLPIRHSYIGVPAQLSITLVIEKLKPILSNRNIKKIGHDIKHELRVLDSINVEVDGVAGDSMLLAHFINSSYSKELHDLSELFLNYTMINSADIFETKNTTADSIDIEVILKYAGEMALNAHRLFNTLYKKIENDEHSVTLFNFDMQVLEVLYLMEKNGTLVNEASLQALSAEFRGYLKTLEKRIYEQADQVFRITSTKELGKILFEKMKLPYPKKIKVDKNGNRTYSTAEDVLSQLSSEYDIAYLVLRHRAVSKLISTYTDKLPELIDKSTGRIHTTFNLAGTNTGRLSSSSPNLQNIPAKTSEGRSIRASFIAPEGYKIVSADYSQIELRLIAHFSQDENLINTFNNHIDVHRATAAEVLGKPLSEVTDKERSHAKTINFGLMYGMGSHGLAAQTGMTNSEAKEYIEKYFERYPKIKTYMDGVIEQAKKQGYISSIDGHHIYIKNIKTTGMALRGAERAAINAPMQASAADIIRRAMVELQNYLFSLGVNKVKMTLQVHDELVFEVHDSIVDEFCVKVKQIMENIVKLNVPLEVGIGVGSNWEAAH